MTNEEKYTEAFMQAFDIDAETARGLEFQAIPPGTPWGIWDLLPLWKKPSTSCSNLMILWI